MSNPQENFDESYYLRGEETGKSNYTDYKWEPDRTISWAQHLKQFMRLGDGDTVLDVGCATGNYVRALRLLGVDAYGYDISEWAISNAAQEVRPYLFNHPNGSNYDFIFSKDCFEHIEPSILKNLVRHYLTKTPKMFVIVPLAASNGGAYVHGKEENDPTHVNRWTLHDWLMFFQGCSPSFIVNGSYRYPGLKPGCYEVECAYAFITLTKS